MSVTPKISVIIPIYKAELYIKRCAHSLFSQTLEDIEYIFVDDCTPDDSIKILREVLESYPQRKSLTKIIRMDKNSKQAAARNMGLRHTTGKYIIHCDPDDWVDSDYYQQLYDKAEEEGLDIVASDYKIHETKEEGKIIRITRHETPLSVLKDRNFYFASLCWHLVRASIIKEKGIHFEEGINFMEDLCFLSKVFLASSSIGYISNSYYNYNKLNENQITRKNETEENMTQRIRGIKIIDRSLEEKGFKPKEFHLIMRTKRDIRDIYLKNGNYKKWRKTFPEVGHWEFSQSTSSFFYRLIYWISSVSSSKLIQLYSGLK